MATDSAQQWRSAAYAYGQYLGRRYKRFANMVWLNGNFRSIRITFKPSG
jgi:hypothetical protein